jgi:hypothetical protein
MSTEYATPSSASSLAAQTATLIAQLAETNPRKSARLRLDFLDARTEHEAGRVSEPELTAELTRIQSELVSV